MDWHHPVLIKPMDVIIDGAGGHRHVDTVQDLVAMLLDEGWPVGQRKKFDTALWRSTEAAAMFVGAHTARAAFVKAAHEVGMRILPDDGA